MKQPPSCKSKKRFWKKNFGKEGGAALSKRSRNPLRRISDAEAALSNYRDRESSARVSDLDLIHGLGSARITGNATLRHCSLFSGIGGFDLGLGQAGIETVMVCENDPAARAVLKKRFGDVRYRKSVEELRSLPNCELLTAGWPCQDLSQAGMTAGITGSQSNLIRHVFRLLDAKRRKPQYVLLENVSFALHLQNGKAIRTVVRELARRGYRWAYRILNTREFGLPQRRRRIFIVGALDVDPAAILFDGTGIATQESRSRYVGFYWTEGNRGIGWTYDSVPPLKGGSGLSIPSPPAIWDRRSHNFFSPGIRDAERLQGFKAGWTSAAAENSSDRSRWRLIGNAISVPIAKWIGGRTVAMNSGSLCCATLPEGQSSKRHNMAWGGPGKRPTRVYIELEGPAKPKRATLVGFDFADATPLSTRAASGFLSRLVESPLVVEHPFLVDLGRYCGRYDLVQSKAAA